MTTIKDVAQTAGVSVATVSRTLSGSSRVADATRARVLAAVAQLDYRPDQVARSLRRRRTNLIGLVVSTIENRFFTEVAHAAEKAAHERGYNLIVCNTDEDPEQEKTYLRVLEQQQAAGIILAPAPGDESHLVEYVQKGLPIVLINRRLDHLAVPTITSNDEESAYQCVNHLIGQGRRRIAAIRGLQGTYTTQERLHGYRRALSDAGLPCVDALEVDGHATLDGAFTAACQLLQADCRPDALFAFNNLMVQGVVVAIHALGMHWPDDVDVAGFGASALARLYHPPLTLVQQPTRAMGRRAIELLAERLAGKPRSGDLHVVLHNRLIYHDAWRSSQVANGALAEFA